MLNKQLLASCLQFLFNPSRKVFILNSFLLYVEFFCTITHKLSLTKTLCQVQKLQKRVANYAPARAGSRTCVYFGIRSVFILIPIISVASQSITVLDSEGRVDSTLSNDSPLHTCCDCFNIVEGLSLTSNCLGV